MDKIIHPSWDREKIDPRNKLFDKALYEQRRKYLMSVDDKASTFLETNDKYDRICYLREKEAMEQYKRNRAALSSQSEQRPTAQRSKTIYKTWGSD
jgi:hypothetical protein